MLGGQNVITAIIFVGVIVGAAIIYIAGYSAGKDSKTAEMDALRAANDRVIALAEKDLREDLAVATLEKERLQNALEALEAGADADAGADDVGMSLDGVRRHNALK